MENLLTRTQISEATGLSTTRLRYIIERFRIKPIRRVGHTDLFQAKALDDVRQAVLKIEQREVSKEEHVQGHPLKRRHFNITCPKCGSSEVRQASTRKKTRWCKCESCGLSFKVDRFASHATRPSREPKAEIITSPPVINPMLTREQVAVVFNVSARTIDKMRRDGQLPFRQFGRTHRYCALLIKEMAEVT